MIQKSYFFNSIEELEAAAADIKNDPAYLEAGSRVLLTWAQVWDKGDFDIFCDTIYRLFPDCTTLGTNHYSDRDIMEGRIDGSSPDHCITMTLLFLRTSRVVLKAIEPGMQEEERQGREMCAFLDGLEDVKGVYFIPPDYNCSSEAVMAAGLRGHKDVPVFGIKTSVLPDYDNFAYEQGGDLIKHHLFLLAFCGKGLSIRLHYNLGWTPIGKVMTVTSEENPFFVDEIDGRPATEVYNRYLGLKDNQIIPENLSEFPLIILREDMKISRISISGLKKGQLIFGAPVYTGERICLSYGNPEDLFSEIREDSREVGDFHPQAGLLLVCSIRLMLLKERELEEIEYYKKHMASLAAIYGFAEIYYHNGMGAELNSALVSVAFREDDAQDDFAPAPESVSDAKPISEDTLVPFHDRMTRFFKEMSKDLLETVNEAETANRAKSVFYSAISHDIRTLLNSILGMNEMILNESHEEDILQYAENTSISGRMLLDLINDILDTEKIEAGKMKIVPVDYEIGKVIKELTEMAAGPAANKSLKLTVEKSGQFPPVLTGDAKRIKQCTLNLLSNAIKYTESGEVILRINVEPDDASHVILNVSVKDTGIGIKPGDIEKLSIPFERVDQSRNHNIEGTGLGLNIVRNLLELMGSSLKIESTYGEGSEFSFSVKQEIKKNESGAPKASIDKEVPDKTLSSFRAPDASILIVDDTPSNIKIMQLFLKESQVKIDTATSGIAAIEMIRRKRYDIVFLDHMMPGMDGLETFSRIKEEKGSPNTDSVFIMLTANDKTGIRDFFLSKGFDDFLTKPLQRNSLLEILAKYL